MKKIEIIENKLKIITDNLQKILDILNNQGTEIEGLTNSQELLRCSQEILCESHSKLIDSIYNRTYEINTERRTNVNYIG